MEVREIMTIDVATASPDSTLEEVALMMRDEDAGAIPVLDGGKLVGIVTDRDIVLRCIAEGKDAVETTVEDIESEALEVIEPDADVEEAIDLMARKRIRRLPVVERGRLVGMLSLGDIAVKSDTDTGKALGNVCEGVKASGGRGRKKVTSIGARATGREASLRSQGTRSQPTQGVRARARAERQAEERRRRKAS